MNFEMEKKSNGHVMNDTTEIALTQQAYVENYARGVRYYASGIDRLGNVYQVAWETTQAWDEAQAAYLAALRNGETPDAGGMLDDESNACDWDSPVSIKLIEAADED